MYGLALGLLTLELCAPSVGPSSWGHYIPIIHIAYRDVNAPFKAHSLEGRGIMRGLGVLGLGGWFVG